ncbi:MAG: glycoside hydrolase family 127 protein [Clostridia bacterium]|nr:glycoside hydrolase family 127 protein [Clostridia bacterium]
MIQRVDYSKVQITGGFWRKKQELIRDVTVQAVYDRFKDTGRIDAFRCDKNAPVEPHFFWDSDVAKWMEGVAYLLRARPNEGLERILDELVDEIEKNQDADGYFNIYHTVVEPQNRFKIRDHHELYCAGHLMEAAVAYYEATGKRKFLDLMCKYADYIERRFKIDRDAAFVTPGHEEIELALVRLYETTGERRYLELSRFFVDERGVREEKLMDWTAPCYHQSHQPAREQFTAEGHAVRAVYFYSAMADLALHLNDTALKTACERIFDDIVEHKMYVTGGLGSSFAGEAFTVPYDLPNLIAYTESCAAIGLVFFAQRMLLLTNDAKYADVIERVLYNGFLSALSLDGKAFFYCNPLEIVPYLHDRDRSTTHKSLTLPQMQRQEVFGCSCCPPNIVRFIPSLSGLIYTQDETAVYVHQFMESKAALSVNGRDVTVEQKTCYPSDGRVTLSVRGGDVTLCVRIPAYTRAAYTGELTNGYVTFHLHDGEEVTLDFDLTPRLTEANPNVVFDAGRCAVERGPVVYCMEGVYNGSNLRDIRIRLDAAFTEGFDETLGVPTLSVDAFRRKPRAELYSPVSREREAVTARLIPYYAFANRGETEMQVWHLVE